MPNRELQRECAEILASLHQHPPTPHLRHPQRESTRDHKALNRGTLCGSRQVARRLWILTNFGSRSSATLSWRGLGLGTAEASMISQIWSMGPQFGPWLACFLVQVRFNGLALIPGWYVCAHISIYTWIPDSGSIPEACG